jgi:type I restriction enzyme S subunit
MEILKPRFDVHNYNGTTFGAITKDELYEMPVVFPNRNLICQYESKVNAMFDNQLLLSKQNQLLTSYRDFLLPMLMNGQVTVK